MSNSKPSNLADKFLAKLHDGQNHLRKNMQENFSQGLQKPNKNCGLYCVTGNWKEKSSENHMQSLIIWLIFTAMNLNLQLNRMEIFIVKQKGKNMISQGRLYWTSLVSRFWNEEVVKDPSKVLQKI